MTGRAEGGADTALIVEGLRARYGGQDSLVLDVEHLEIGRGERVAFIGPSGAGKTTLLRLINGYVLPESGRVTLLGEPIEAATSRRREARLRVGFIFQDFNLIDRATVFTNVLTGRLGRLHPVWSLLGLIPRADKRAAVTAIAEVDLEGQIQQRADTLSGGQKQRVAVARVLAQEPEIILADEPVSNLDPTLADDILGLLTEVVRQHGVTLIMSLHQPVLAQQYAGRVIGLRRGRVVFDAAPEQLDEHALRQIYGREAALGHGWNGAPGGNPPGLGETA